MNPNFIIIKHQVNKYFLNFFSQTQDFLIIVELSRGFWDRRLDTLLILELTEWYVVSLLDIEMDEGSITGCFLSTTGFDFLAKLVDDLVAIRVVVDTAGGCINVVDAVRFIGCCVLAAL